MNYLPLGLFTEADCDFDDSILFDNLIGKIEKKAANDPGEVMKTFLCIHKLTTMDSFLFRIIKLTDKRNVEKHIEVLNSFYNRIFDPSCIHLIELYKFIEMYFLLNGIGKQYFDKYPEHLKNMTTACTKFLNSMRSIHKENLSANEQMFRYELCSSVAWFLSKINSPWRGIKLLLAVFRSSKIEWLNPDLSCNAEKFRYKNLAFSILKFFESNNTDSLEQLCQDMAKGLAELLKPIPVKRLNPNRIADYEDSEKKLDGFDPSLFEPNPLFRYAYVRAIGDLKINIRGNGRHLYSILKNVGENDLSEMVRKAAGGVCKKLATQQNKLPEENSGYLLNEVFWWIRSAYMKNLNFSIDEKTAKERRIYEIRQYK
jgi:hypothetical protein